MHLQQLRDLVVYGQFVGYDVLQVPAGGTVTRRAAAITWTITALLRHYEHHAQPQHYCDIMRCSGGVLVSLHQPQLQRAQGEDLFRHLLAQARDVEVFDVSQQVLYACL